MDSQEACRPGCVICCTSKPPMAAYRPHTLDSDCWCCLDGLGGRVLQSCWVARNYLGPVKVIEA